MKYKYICNDCQTSQVLKRHVDDRNNPAPCSCGGEAQRVFSASFQLITDRVADRGENKYALGFDETTRKETMKADDKRYEKAWDGKTPSKPAPPKESLVDTYVKMWGAR